MHPELNSLVRAPYFDTYLKTLESSDVQDCLQSTKQRFVEVISNLTDDQMNYRYQSDKWTIKELVIHLIDTEMIFNYRALRIGRDMEEQDLEGFDENEYAQQARVDLLSKDDLVSYFTLVRDSSMLLHKTFSEDQLNKIGVASGHKVEVRALFLINSGHTLHHLKIINERYLS